MKVRDLIKELKKMPQDINVYYSHHDNSRHEAAGETFSLDHIKKKDIEPCEISDIEKEDFENMPNEWVTIRG